MKAKLLNKMMPFEMVEFDFNPTSMATSRTAGSTNNPTGGAHGSSPSIFRGSQPKTLQLKDAKLEGLTTGERADQLCKWMDPGGGLLGRLAGAALSAISGGHINLASKLPVLMFMWGPFIMECTMSQVSVDFKRFSAAGLPTRASVNLTLKEEAGLLAMLPTNPTSGGLPGRQAHVMAEGENLHLIAARTYGNPGAWRSVAECNGIDDPFRIPVGRTVYLPNAGELNGG